MSTAMPPSKCSNVEKCHTEQKLKMQLYQNVEKQLNSDYYPINLAELKNFSYYGFSTSALRPKLWKLFLNLHSKNKFKNKQTLAEKRKVYCDYRLKAMEEIIENSDSHRVIIADLDRTMVNPMSYVVEGEETRSCHFMESVAKYSDPKVNHKKVLERILATFKSTNKSIGYVQGMNMILLPIYFVFVTSTDEEDVRFAEEDAYFCFFNLMAEIGELFVGSFDEDQTLGIKNKISDVFEKLEFFDSELHAHLMKIDMKDSLFSFRWITLLFAQEFPISEVLFLWDRFLADCNRFEIVVFCCVAILIANRKFLLANTFEACMEKLQSSSKIDAEEMFVKADDLRKQFYAS